MAKRGPKLVPSGPEPLTAHLPAKVAQWRQVADIMLE